MCFPFFLLPEGDISCSFFLVVGGVCGRVGGFRLEGYSLNDMISGEPAKTRVSLFL